MNKMDSKRRKNINQSDQNRQPFPRDSFDRFGDDICEEILQYLTFADKIRLQCLSKQFSRTVFAKQYRIIADIRYQLFI